ncbi:proto-oncogene Mas-like [Pleurodeles waltl]|uniref:proto-oncogene Mas-like n=1 Tax=Pleurodeles waltl TaxID=8319 RepID=UPI003709A628
MANQTPTSTSTSEEMWSADAHGWFDRPGEEDHTLLLTLRCLSLVFSLIGLLGNGTVLWYLYFGIPSNQFTVYILNLALADLTDLSSSFITLLYVFGHPRGQHSSATARNVLLTLRLFRILGYNTSLYLLAAISLERCVSVLKPMWYKFQRSRHQSVIVCVMLWGLSCLMTGPEFFFCDEEMYETEDFQCSAVLITSFSFGFIIVAPLMVISNLTLICKIGYSSQQHQRPKLYIVIVISVLFFLISTLPPRILELILYYKVLPPRKLSFFSAQHVSMFCSTINGSVDPFIYVFVGGLWKNRGKGPIHAALHRAFKSEPSIIGHEEKSNISTLYR